jgi:hypothetical protein
MSDERDNLTDDREIEEDEDLDQGDGPPADHAGMEKPMPKRPMRGLRTKQKSRYYD